jgi:dihydroorotate dehydrogenase (NAD+) catalytic subunit
MIPNLGINFLGIELKNPVLTASGTFGYGYEAEDLIPLKKLGGIITKTITLHPRFGNPQPRIVEVESGLLNTIGLQNIGVMSFIDEPLDRLSKIGVPIIVSIAGNTEKEYREIAKILNMQNNSIISAVELNLSCPNLRKKPICHNLSLMQNIIKGVKKILKIPIIAKLSPLVADIPRLALAAQNVGANAVTLTNTYPAVAINVKNFTPKLSTINGGMSGSCIKPMSIYHVYNAYQRIKIPIVGCGGIMTGEDAIEFMLAGASVVSVGSASLVSPKNLIKIINEIEFILKCKSIKSIKEVIGIVNSKILK